jgi:hypothetical protein
MTLGTYLDLGPLVFEQWSAFWRNHNCAPPPLIAYKPTLNGGIIMLAPLPAPWGRDFVTAQTTDPEIAYETQGETLVESSPQYLGTWTGFTAIKRTDIPKPIGRPVLPMAMPKVPDVAELKRRWLA